MLTKRGHMIRDPMFAGTYRLHQTGGTTPRNGYIQLWAFTDSTIVEVSFEPRYAIAAHAFLVNGPCSSRIFRKVLELRGAAISPRTEKELRQHGLWDTAQASTPQWGAKSNLTAKELFNQGYSAVLLQPRSGAREWCGDINQSNAMTEPT
jgi:hypothetical protein